MTGNRYANMGYNGRQRVKGLKRDLQPGSSPSAIIMGGSTKFYVAKNRVDDCWEVRQYVDDKPVATDFDNQEEAKAKMLELDNAAN
jgi:hypothetical protein